MQQIRFKNKQSYYEWRTYWRRQYNGICKSIRYYKQLLKNAGMEQHNSTRYLLRREQQLARSMMMAREAVEEGYRHRKIYEAAPDLMLRDLGQGFVDLDQIDVQFNTQSFGPLHKALFEDDINES